MNTKYIKLGKICTFQSGGTPSKKVPEYFSGNIPWITTTALDGGTIDGDSATEKITEEAIKNSAAKIVPANSIMIGTRVGVGKVAINAVPMATSQDIISLLGINESEWSKNYLSLFIQSQAGLLNSKARGATIKGIKIENLAELAVPNISLGEQIQIVRVFGALKETLYHRKYQMDLLEQLVKSRHVGEVVA